MLKATLTTETGQIFASKEMIAVNTFPPAVYLDGGIYLFLMMRSPTEAFYRATRYYHFPPTPVEEEEFSGEFPYLSNTQCPMPNAQCPMPNN